MIKVIDSLPNEDDYDNKAALRSLNKGGVEFWANAGRSKAKKIEIVLSEIMYIAAPTSE